MAGEDSLAEGSYSQLLFADDDVDCFSFSSHFSLDNTPNLQCFEDFSKGNDPKLIQNAPGNSSKTCSNSTHLQLSNENNISNNNVSKSKHKKINGPSKESRMDEKSGEIMKSMNKKAKIETSIPKGHSKVKKEKLGGRITALQQIVSPFGKADTATVLHEARGYIRFLHDQVQVLSSPYLQGLPPSGHLSEVEESVERKPKNDLRSRGLCVVPVELTSHVVTGKNGADLWSPAMVNHSSQNQ
ncbi:basic helix-loop-helix transcription factor [Lithospermum erythrorhizon]|uniref:Basic helix-loop-helix transcription factor n=1 Tax=Lithospermum erythrorhizon TaxID=34254 RepID=A0AAV3PRC5_LITER